MEISISGSQNQLNIATGDHNTQINRLKVSKGNFGELSNFLRLNGVNPVDLKELQIILHADKTNPENRQFGHSVKAWINRVSLKISEAIKGVGIEAAGAILAEGLKYYYGWFK